MSRIQVEVLGLSQSPTSNGSYALILKETDGERRLPIVIGAPEAGAIAYELEGVRTSRPMTHDLLRAVIISLGAKVMDVCINELRDSTFYAAISLDLNDIEVDARPSDAIAIALRFDAPIYVQEKLLEEAGFTPDDYEDGPDAEDEEEDELDDSDNPAEKLNAADSSDDDEEDEIETLKRKAADSEKKVPRSKLDLLEESLQKAVQEEDYEKAARLRDEIQSYKKR
jgi:bifunctional DNase/RNase